MAGADLGVALKRYYARLLGRRQRLLAPPKYETRLVPDRERYAVEEPERLREIEQITADLPHVEYVIRMLDPKWDEKDVKPIRPHNRGPAPLPSTTIAGAAMDALRETGQPLTMGEITRLVAERYDVDISTSDTYQRLHTAVNNGLKKIFSTHIKSVGGSPERFILAGEDET